MYTKIQVVFDAADPGKLAEFWGLVLGYVAEPPPEGFGTWDDFAHSIGLPDEEAGGVASRIDPARGFGVFGLFDFMMCMDDRPRPALTT